MTLANFIPEVWAGNILSNLHKRHVFAQDGLVNRDYEGDITGAGDTVDINSIGPVTIKSYTRNTDIDAPETLTDSQRKLVIDQQKYFNFQVDDIDKAQTKPKVMGEATKEAAYGLADVADRYLAGLYVEAANIGVGTDGATAAAPLILSTPAAAYDLLVDLGVILTDEDVDAAMRSAVVPAWFYGLLLKDDRFVASGSVAADATLRNGVVGQAAGFTILQSTNAPTVVDGTAGTSSVVQVSTPAARSYAEQIVETEAYRPEKRFGDALKGLHVYGAKVARPEALAAVIVQKG